MSFLPLKKLQVTVGTCQVLKKSFLEKSTYGQEEVACYYLANQSITQLSPSAGKRISHPGSGTPDCPGFLTLLT